MSFHVLYPSMIIDDNKSIPSLERFYDSSSNYSFIQLIREADTKDIPFVLFRDKKNKLRIHFYRLSITDDYLRFLRYFKPDLWTDDNVVLLDDQKKKKFGFVDYKSLGLIKFNEEEYRFRDRDYEIFETSDGSKRLLKLDEIIKILKRSDTENLINYITTIDPVASSELKDLNWSRKLGVITEIRTKTKNDNPNQVFFKNLSDYTDGYQDTVHTAIILIKGLNPDKILNKILEDFSYDDFETISPELMRNLEGNSLPKFVFKDFKKIDDPTVNIELDKQGAILNEDYNTASNFNSRKIIFALNKGLITKNARGIAIVENKLRSSRPGTNYMFISKKSLELRKEEYQKAKEFDIFDKNTDSERVKIYDSEKFTDFELRHVKTGTIKKVHKIILYTYGPEYFTRLLDGESFSENLTNQLDISCEHLETFNLLIYCFYKIENRLIEEVEKIFKSIIDFTKANLKVFYLDWKSSPGFDEYSKNISILRDFVENLNYYQLQYYLDFIKITIIYYYKDLSINLGQINPDISNMAFDLMQNLWELLDELDMLTMYYGEDIGSGDAAASVSEDIGLGIGYASVSEDIGSVTASTADKKAESTSDKKAESTSDKKAESTSDKKAESTDLAARLKNFIFL